MPYKNREDRLAKCKERYLQNKDKVKEYGIKYREEKSEELKIRKRKWNLKTRFKITIEDYNIMFNKQDGCCAICNKHQTFFNKRFAVDHDHKTGQIRGLLCDACNLGLGKFDDNVDNLINAIKYLQENKNGN